MPFSPREKTAKNPTSIFLIGYKSAYTVDTTASKTANEAHPCGETGIRGK
jgi:hypothetical protein